MQPRIRPAGLLALVVALMAAPVQAQQSARSLDDRLQRMERELQMLQRDVYKDERPVLPAGPLPGNGGGGVGEVSGAGLARMDERLSQLEGELRALTGALEETTHRIDRIAERLEVFTRDVELRFNELEAGPGASATAATPAAPPEPAPPADGGDAPPTAIAGAGDGVLGTLPVEDLERAEAAAPTAVNLAANPEEAYQQAFRLLQGGDYDAAETAFVSFLEANSGHALAGNARYWLGETYYVRGDYERAAITFLEGYQNHTDGNKAPDSLLKLALALKSLEKGREACAALARLDTEFPDAADTIKRRAEAERQRLDCE